jgi:ribosomal protein L21
MLCLVLLCMLWVVLFPATQAPKVYIFKMRRRKNSKRLRGFRASVTSLRIRAITAP